MGWSCSEDIVELARTSTGVSQVFGKGYNSLEPGGIIYKNVMAKTRREKGKESELQVSPRITYNFALLVCILARA